MGNGRKKHEILEDMEKMLDNPNTVIRGRRKHEILDDMERLLDLKANANTSGSRKTIEKKIAACLYEVENERTRADIARRWSQSWPFNY